MSEMSGAGGIQAQAQERARKQEQVQAQERKQAPPQARERMSAQAGTAEHVKQRSTSALVATFQLLYESRDGRMCLFQDGQGHLTCVRADRLAH